MLSAVRSLIRPLREFLFPSVCFSCDAPLPNQEGRVCELCWSAIIAVSDQDTLYQQTFARLTMTGHVAGLVAAFHFEKESPLQTLIHQLKYSGITDLGVELGRRLGSRIAHAVREIEIAGLIPVPLHPIKQRERGYNQSDYICKGITEIAHLPPITHLLKRNRYTRSQTALSIEERKLNVHDAFSIDPDNTQRLDGQTLVLVDDVITTGATMDACAKTLLEHGAHQVISCSVALAP